MACAVRKTVKEATLLTTLLLYSMFENLHRDLQLGVRCFKKKLLFLGIIFKFTGRKL